MKKEETLDYSRQVKILSKKYTIMDHYYIRLLFQFCEFDGIKTYKVLEMIKDSLIPVAFIKKLVDHPKDSDSMIKDK